MDSSTAASYMSARAATSTLSSGYEFRSVEATDDGQEGGSSTGYIVGAAGIVTSYSFRAGAMGNLVVECLNFEIVLRSRSGPSGRHNSRAHSPEEKEGGRGALAS